MSAAMDDDDVFASKADAMDNAEMFYGADCHRNIKYSGTDESGWRWRYVPDGALVDAEVIRFDPGLADGATYVPTDDYLPLSDRKLELVALADDVTLPAGPEPFAGWTEVDTTSDEAAAEALPELPELDPDEMLSVKLSVTLSRAMVRQLETLLSCSAYPYRLTCSPAKAGKPGRKPASTDSTPRQPDPNKCHVAGTSWNIEVLRERDPTNYKACLSMKSRIDNAYRAGDLLMLKTFSWAGCEGNPGKGNTYGRQGGQYLANCIRQLEYNQDADARAMANPE